MNVIKRHFIAAMLCLVSSAAAAFTPESGFYVVPSQPGTGVAVEIQNQFVFLAGYVYDTTGRPTFVTAQGGVLKTPEGWRLESPLFVSQNGQCIGRDCAYRAPTTVAAGTVRVDFFAENVMQITWGPAGQTQQLDMVRGEFAAGGLESLLGEWDIVINQPSGENFLYAGDKLGLSAVLTTPNQPRRLSGCVVRFEGNSLCSDQGVTVTGAPNANGIGSNYTAVVTDAGSKVLRVYRFSTFGLGTQFSNTFKGVMRTCTNVTSDGPSCIGTEVKMVGYKSASRQYSETGVGMD